MKMHLTPSETLRAWCLRKAFYLSSCMNAQMDAGAALVFERHILGDSERLRAPSVDDASGVGIDGEDVGPIGADTQALAFGECNLDGNPLDKRFSREVGLGGHGEVPVAGLRTVTMDHKVGDVMPCAAEKLSRTMRRPPLRRSRAPSARFAAFIIRWMPKLSEQVIEQVIGGPAEEKAFCDAICCRAIDRTLELFAKPHGAL